MRSFLRRKNSQKPLLKMFIFLFFFFARYFAIEASLFGGTIIFFMKNYHYCNIL